MRPVSGNLQNQNSKTLKRRNYIAARIKADFPGGAGLVANKIIRSHVSACLASYNFGSASHNLFLEFIQAA